MKLLLFLKKMFLALFIFSIIGINFSALTEGTNLEFFKFNDLYAMRAKDGDGGGGGGNPSYRHTNVFHCLIVKEIAFGRSWVQHGSRILCYIGGGYCIWQRPECE